MEISERQISEHQWQTDFHNGGASAKFVFNMLAYPESAILLLPIYIIPCILKIYIKLPGDLGMSK